MNQKLLRDFEKKNDERVKKNSRIKEFWAKYLLEVEQALYINTLGPRMPYDMLKILIEDHRELCEQYRHVYDIGRALDENPNI